VDGTPNHLGGGFLKGSYNVLEFDDDVHEDAFMGIIRTLLMNFVAQKRGVVILPTQGKSPIQIRKALADYLPDEEFHKHVRVITSRPADEPWAISTYNLSPGDRSKAWEEGMGSLKSNCPGSILDITGIDTLEYDIGGVSAVKDVSQSIQKIKDEGDLGIGLMKPGLIMGQQIKNMSDTILHIAEAEGSYILFGMKPKTEAFSIDFDEQEGGDVFLRLTPIT